MCQRTAPAKFREARRVFADKRFSQADDVDDGEALHRGIAAKKRKRRKGNFDDRWAAK